MTIHVVSLGIILVLGARCTAQPTCTLAEAADPATKVTPAISSKLSTTQLKATAEAQFQAGVSYETGCGVPQDYAQAFTGTGRRLTTGILGRRTVWVGFTWKAEA